jgi:hypothetical protein
VAALEPFTRQSTIAPGRVFCGAAQEQCFNLRVGGWSSSVTLLSTGPLAPYQLAVPIKEGSRLEEKGHVVQAVPAVAPKSCQFARKDGAGGRVPTRNQGLVGWLAWAQG